MHYNINYLPVHLQEITAGTMGSDQSVNFLVTKPWAQFSCQVMPDFQIVVTASLLGIQHENDSAGISPQVA